MKNIHKHLGDARHFIQDQGAKKDGYNDYSKYAYYTPEQITTLVSGACKDKGLITLFDLKWGSLGLTGYLKVVHIESGEFETFEMATAIPEITATNATQQVGGAVTYTKRYLLMTAFDIADNSLDPDNTHNTTKSEEQVDDKKWLNKVDKKGTILESYNVVIKWAKEKKIKDAKGLRAYYKINNDTATEVDEDLK